MNKLLPILILFGFITIAYSQNQNSGSLVYRISTSDDGKLIDATTNNVVPICVKLKGFIKLNTDGTVSFDVFRITQDSQQSLDYNAANPGLPQCITSATALPTTPRGTNRFLINLPARTNVGSPTPVQYLAYRSINFGVSTIGARFRGEDNTGKNTVSPGLAAAFNVGYTRGFAQISPRKIAHYYLNLGGFIGVSSAELNTSTVNRKETWTDKQTNATVSYGPCLIIGRQNLGLIFTYGWENALGSNGNRWIYNNKPWFGIGLSGSLGYF